MITRTCARKCCVETCSGLREYGTLAAASPRSRKAGIDNGPKEMNRSEAQRARRAREALERRSIAHQPPGVMSVDKRTGIITLPGSKNRGNEHGQTKNLSVVLPADTQGFPPPNWGVDDRLYASDSCYGRHRGATVGHVLFPSGAVVRDTQPWRWDDPCPRCASTTEFGYCVRCTWVCENAARLAPEALPK